MRLFISVPFDGIAEKYITAVSGACRSLSESGRFSPPERYHITLAFLGELPAARIPEIVRAMQETAVPPFSVTLGGIGQFRQRDGNVLWIGAEGSALHTLRAALTRRLSAAGIPVDHHDFRPHITLARRFVPSARFDPTLIQRRFQPLEYTVSSFCLMESSRPDGVLTYTEQYRRGLSHDRF